MQQAQEKCNTGLVKEPWGKRSLGNPQHTREGNIRMNLTQK